jgi:hypothetical protein
MKLSDLDFIYYACHRTWAIYSLLCNRRKTLFSSPLHHISTG